MATYTNATLQADASSGRALTLDPAGGDVVNWRVTNFTLQDVAGGVGQISFDGVANTLEFLDDVKAIFGTGGDWELFTDSTDADAFVIQASDTRDYLNLKTTAITVGNAVDQLPVSIYGDTTHQDADILWASDGGGNIGASGATRPDHVYAKTDVVVGDTVTLGSTGLTLDDVGGSGADSIWTVQPNTTTSEDGWGIAFTGGDGGPSADNPANPGGAGGTVVITAGVGADGTADAGGGGSDAGAGGSIDLICGHAGAANNGPVSGEHGGFVSVTPGNTTLPAGAGYDTSGSLVVNESALGSYGDIALTGGSPNVKTTQFGASFTVRTNSGDIRFRPHLAGDVLCYADLLPGGANDLGAVGSEWAVGYINELQAAGGTVDVNGSLDFTGGAGTYLIIPDETQSNANQAGAIRVTAAGQFQWNTGAAWVSPSGGASSLQGAYEGGQTIVMDGPSYGDLTITIDDVGSVGGDEADFILQGTGTENYFQTDGANTRVQIGDLTNAISTEIAGTTTITIPDNTADAFLIDCGGNELVSFNTGSFAAYDWLTIGQSTNRIATTVYAHAEGSFGHGLYMTCESDEAGSSPTCVSFQAARDADLGATRTLTVLEAEALARPGDPVGSQIQGLLCSGSGLGSATKSALVIDYTWDNVIRATMGGGGIMDVQVGDNASDLVFVFPDNDPSGVVDPVLTSDASGNTTWVSAGSFSSLTLQQAYEAGNTIALDSANGDLAITLGDVFSAGGDFANFTVEGDVNETFIATDASSGLLLLGDAGDSVGAGIIDVNVQNDLYVAGQVKSGSSVIIDGSGTSDFISCSQAAFFTVPAANASALTLTDGVNTHMVVDTSTPITVLGAYPAGGPIPGTHAYAGFTPVGEVHAVPTNGADFRITDAATTFFGLSTIMGTGVLGVDAVSSFSKSVLIGSAGSRADLSVTGDADTAAGSPTSHCLFATYMPAVPNTNTVAIRMSGGVRTGGTTLGAGQHYYQLIVSTETDFADDASSVVNGLYLDTSNITSGGPQTNAILIDGNDTDSNPTYWHNFVKVGYNAMNYFLRFPAFASLEAVNRTFVFPDTDPSGVSDPVLTTDASGNTSWVDINTLVASVTLQNAYEGGNAIALDSANGDLAITLGDVLSAGGDFANFTVTGDAGEVFIETDADDGRLYLGESNGSVGAGPVDVYVGNDLYVGGEVKSGSSIIIDGTASGASGEDQITCSRELLFNIAPNTGAFSMTDGVGGPLPAGTYVALDTSTGASMWFLNVHSIYNYVDNIADAWRVGNTLNLNNSIGSARFTMNANLEVGNASGTPGNMRLEGCTDASTADWEDVVNFYAVCEDDNYGCVHIENQQSSVPSENHLTGTNQTYGIDIELNSPVSSDDSTTETSGVRIYIEGWAGIDNGTHSAIKIADAEYLEHSPTFGDQHLVHAEYNSAADHFYLDIPSLSGGVSRTFVFPANDPSPDDVLTTDTDGVTSWASLSSLSSLQTSYEGGNTIALDSASGDLAITLGDVLSAGGDFANLTVAGDAGEGFLQTDVDDGLLILGDGTNSIHLRVDDADMLWETDGGGDIGAVGANRPDHVYAKTDVVIGDTVTITSDAITGSGALTFESASSTDINLTPGSGGRVNVSTALTIPHDSSSTNAGDVRYNTTSSELEWYDGGSWQSAAGGMPSGTTDGAVLIYDTGTSAWVEHHRVQIGYSSVNLYSDDGTTQRGSLEGGTGNTKVRSHLGDVRLQPATGSVADVWAFSGDVVFQIGNGDPDVASFTWSDSTENLTIDTPGSINLTPGSSDEVIINGDSQFEGDVQLGSSSTDDISFIGQVHTNIASDSTSHTVGTAADAFGWFYANDGIRFMDGLSTSAKADIAVSGTSLQCDLDHDYLDYFEIYRDTSSGTWGLLISNFSGDRGALEYDETNDNLVLKTQSGSSGTIRIYPDDDQIQLYGTDPTLSWSTSTATDRATIQWDETNDSLKTRTEEEYQTIVEILAESNVSAGRAVKLHAGATYDGVAYADDSAPLFFGIMIESPSAGSRGDCVTAGMVDASKVSAETWTYGEPVFLQDSSENGVLTNVDPSGSIGSDWVVQVGYALEDAAGGVDTCKIFVQPMIRGQNPS